MWLDTPVGLCTLLQTDLATDKTGNVVMYVYTAELSTLGRINNVKRSLEEKTAQVTQHQESRNLSKMTFVVDNAIQSKTHNNDVWS